MQYQLCFISLPELHSARLNYTLQLFPQFLRLVRLKKPARRVKPWCAFCSSPVKRYVIFAIAARRRRARYTRVSERASNTAAAQKAHAAFTGKMHTTFLRTHSPKHPSQYTTAHLFLPANVHQSRATSITHALK